MPQGKGTYGSKVGRPPKKEKYMTLSSDLGKIEVTGSMEDTAFSRKNAPLQKTVRERLKGLASFTD